MVAEVEGWSLQKYYKPIFKICLSKSFSKTISKQTRRSHFCSLVTSHLNRSPSGESRSTCANSFKQMHVICIFLNYFILKLNYF